MISIIVPIFNEEHVLRENLKEFTNLSNVAELIFVDGGSNDQSCKIASSIGRVISSEKGRAVQMNRGAAVAQNDTYLFLHADTILTRDHLVTIENAIHNRGYIGGCFSQVYDSPRLIFRWIAFTGNVRAKLMKVFYGDQGIFVRKDIFWKIGGYPETKICEDVFFTRKLKSYGRVGLLSDRIYSSSRRWTKQGIMRTFFLNMRINMGLLFGEDIEQLALEYKDIRENTIP